MEDHDPAKEVDDFVGELEVVDSELAENLKSIEDELMEEEPADEMAQLDKIEGIADEDEWLNDADLYEDEEGIDEEFLDNDDLLGEDLLREEHQSLEDQQEYQMEEDPKRLESKNHESSQRLETEPVLIVEAKAMGKNIPVKKKQIPKSPACVGVLLKKRNFTKRLSPKNKARGKIYGSGPGPSNMNGDEFKGEKQIKATKKKSESSIGLGGVPKPISGVP